MRRSLYLVVIAIVAIVVTTAAAQAEILFGAGSGEPEVLYRLDTDDRTATPVCNIGPSLAPGNPNSPNGLGYDAANQRLYFSINEETGDGGASGLYFCDLTSGSIFAAGTLVGQAAGATFDQTTGQYLYIRNGTDDLVAVSLDASGIKTGESVIAANFSGSDDIVFRGGDLAIDCEGVVYGSSLGSGTGSKVFFSIDTANDNSYNLIHSDEPSENNSNTGFATAKQLSFGQNGGLYSQTGGTYWIVNTATGSQAFEFTIPEGAPIAMTDLASGLNCGDDELCYASETAWAAGYPYNSNGRGNWATYTPYPTDPVIIYAGQTLDAGVVSLEPDGSGNVVITIFLQNGFVFSQFEEDGKPLEENLHIQPYEVAPEGNPAPGKFEFKSLESGTFAQVTVPVADFYGIHVVVDDTSRIVPCPEPEFECADFSVFQPGASVEGLGTVLTIMEIDTPTEGAVAVFPGLEPGVYGAPNNGTCGGSGFPTNGCLDPEGGFSDDTAENNNWAHSYTFTFTEPLSDFTLRMLDYGDFNPTNAGSHLVTMTAFDALDSQIDFQTLEYNSSTATNPRSGDFGDMACPVTNPGGTGDACSAPLGAPGNYSWTVSGSGITKVTLVFGVGHDPKIAFDNLCIATE